MGVCLSYFHCIVPNLYLEFLELSEGCSMLNVLRKPCKFCGAFSGCCLEVCHAAASFQTEKDWSREIAIVFMP